MTDQPIQVTTHVARDFMQNAAYFNTMPKLIWEYVANSLDAAQEDVLAMVVVEITNRYATISDNSRGMSREELGVFFQMHGENIFKLRGKRVRGRFGTGKCAAFGLANRLRIDTVHNGLRNVVELHRRDIERARGGEPFPVRDLVANEPVDEPNGTIVEVCDFNIKRPNIDKVIVYIERHLSRYRQRAHVTVNGHECKFQEPPFVEQHERFPPPEVAEHVGQVILKIKVSPIPLDDGVKGIDVLSYGIWHGTTLAGIEKRERANYLFGYIDVPILEDGQWAIPAFDNTRNNTLNPQNPVVTVLLGWMAEELEEIRTQVVEKELERRKSETAQQLGKEARRISRILNDDFAQQEFELEMARRAAGRLRGKLGQRSPSEEQAQSDHGDGSDAQHSWQAASGLNFEWEFGEDGGNDGAPREFSAGIGGLASDDGDGVAYELLECLPEDEVIAPRAKSKPARSNQDSKTEPKEEKSRKKKQPIFRIDFESAADNSPRSRYDSESKMIFINLDHPQVATAFESGGQRTDSWQFLAICYEIIVVEYALAIPYEKLEKGELTDPSDALFDVRDTINRVTRRFMKVLGP